MKFLTGIVFLLLMSASTFPQTKPSIGKNKIVLLDDFFNHETKKDESGKTIVWHYKWNDASNGGYSLWGKIFEDFGARIATLSVAPTTVNLKNADVYIIVDPDDIKESPQPNFVEENHISAIKDWVKKGGVLVLMANDFGNCEFVHFNRLANNFGIEFNKDIANRVESDNFSQGKLAVGQSNPVFKTARTLFLKDISTLKLSAAAKPVFNDDKRVIMATAKFGKGAVFAVGDPWIYNEYIDGRRLPAEFDNFKAAQDLSLWLLQQAKRK